MKQSEILPLGVTKLNTNSAVPRKGFRKGLKKKGQKTLSPAMLWGPGGLLMPQMSDFT